VVVAGVFVTVDAEPDPIVGSALSLGDSVPPVPPTVRRIRRTRRPSGAPPPLPRKIGRSGRGWIVFLVLLVLWLAFSLESPRTRHATDQVDAFILRGLARLRTDWITATARGIDRLATGWTIFYVTVALLISTAFFRRWRHLFTFLGSVVVMVFTGSSMISTFRRPRLYDITTIGR